MFRVLIAAILLRNLGADVKYIVRRIYNGVKGKGTTILTAHKFTDARAKFKAMRGADTDTITITVEAVVAQRHGTVPAKGPISQKESAKE